MAAEHLADDAKTVDQRSPERTKRTYSRHELSASRTKVRLRGLGALDRRTASARAVVAFRTDLERDMGGEDALSIQERALVDMAARAWALLGHVDVYLFERESLVDKRRKQLLPVLKERQALADHLSRLLGQLGLQRRAKEATDPLKALREWKATRPALAGAPAPLALDVPSRVVEPASATTSPAATEEPPRVEIAQQRGEEAPATPAESAAPAVQTEQPSRAAPPEQPQEPAEPCVYCKGTRRLGKGTLNAPWTPCPWCTPKPPAPEVPQPIVATPGDAGAHFANQHQQLGRFAPRSEFLRDEDVEAVRDVEASKVWGPHL